MVLLREAARVTRKAIIIKDHDRKGLFALTRLRLMDHVGNARFGVQLRDAFPSPAEWSRMFEEIHLTVTDRISQLHMYPIPLDWIFGASLHFIARLAPNDPSRKM